MQAGQSGARSPGLGEALDTGPIATLRYSLGADDLAAHLARTKRGRRQARGTLASAAFAGLMALNFLTGKLPVPDNGLGTALEIAAILGAPVALAIWKLRHDRRSEAREELPAPVDVTLQVFSDHAVEQRSDRATPLTHRARTSHRIHANRHHVAIESDRAVLVIPARAFSDRKAMTVLADHWQAQQR